MKCEVHGTHNNIRVVSHTCSAKHTGMHEFNVVL